MADRDKDDSSHSRSASRSKLEELSDCERNDNTIPSIPPIEQQDNGEDNSAAIELFLEQVAASTTSNGNNSNNSSTTKETGRVKDKERELKRAKRMVIPPECKCHLNNGEPCHTHFSVGELMDTRMHYMSISKKELDIAVLAKLECGIHLTKMTRTKKCKPTERKNHRTDFYHRGYRICNLMFIYLHGFSYKKLKALIQQYKTNGVRTRIHKNLKPRPPECEGKPRKKKPKSKPKPKPKPKEKNLKKPQVTKAKEMKTVRENVSSNQRKTMLQYHNISPTAMPPPQHHHPYPVAFSVSHQTGHPQATAFMPPPHNPQHSYPNAVSYNAINSASVFAAHSIPGHSSHPHPAMSNHCNSPLD